MSELKYEKILRKIPYSVIEDHLRRRKEEVEDFMEYADGSS